MPSICRGCGQSINGSYVSALGAQWHPEHFVCASCKRPITQPEFNVQDGAAYHVECYRQRIARRCALCGKPLVGEYIVDYWGATYCKEHKQNPACAYCGRLMIPGRQTQTPGGACCSICYGSAVTTAEQAKPYFAGVKSWIISQGMTFSNHPLSLELCGRDRLTMLADADQQGHMLGVTMGTMQTRGRTTTYEVRGVAILHSLPALLFQGVTVHELGHVWMIVNGIRGLPSWAEEGFCEWLSYHFYLDQRNQDGEYWASTIELRKDPVYGAGFQYVRKVADVVGKWQLLETLRTTKELPRVR